jgi:hypothetical protein
MTALVELYGVSHGTLIAWVCKHYGLTLDGAAQFMNRHRMRREAMAVRAALLPGQAQRDVETLIDQIYETDEYQRTLKRYVRIALEQNVMKRINDEIASLYDKPALRLFPDAPRTPRSISRSAAFVLHEVMQEAHRLTTLCNEILLWQYEGADGKNKLRIITPDLIDAIPTPRMSS